MLRVPWLKQTWERCQRLARGVREFLRRVLLAIIYFVFLLPFGLFCLFFADTLSIKNLPAEWLDRPDETFDIQSARKR